MTRLRRAVSVLLSITLVFCTSSFATAGTRGAGSWTQDGYGPGNTGYNPDAGPLPLEALQLDWAVTPATGVDGCATTPGPPLVSAGRVFLYDDGGIGAYAVDTGRSLWRNSGFSLIGPALAVVDGLVLTTDSSCWSQSDFDGTVRALDAATGAVRWSARQSGTVDFLVADRGVVVTHGFCGTCGDHQDQVIAWRTTDGHQLWHRQDSLLAGPVSAGGRVIVTTHGRSQAVDVSTGKTLWTSKTPWWSRSAGPDGTRFYATNGNDLAALDAGTGKIVWQVPAGAGTIAADGRRVFVTATGVVAYDAATGRKLWARLIPNAGHPIRAAGVLWITVAGKAPVLLSPVDGKPVGSGRLFAGASGHLVVAAGRVFTSDGVTVRAYQPDH